MTEKEIERRMRKLVCERGGLIYKFIGLESGLPDRILILPNGVVWFVELKTKKGKLSKIQKFQISEMQKRNANVCVLYGHEVMEDFITEVFDYGKS